MKSLRPALIAFLAMLSLTGCVDFSLIVKVKPDGSGTIEETEIYNRAYFIAAMRALLDSGERSEDATGKSAGKQEGRPQSPVTGTLTLVLNATTHFWSKEKVQQEAADFGEGVTLVSVKPIEDKRSDGYAAIFAFTDITKLHLAPKVDGVQPAGVDGNGPQKPATAVQFQFAKGSPAELVVVMGSATQDAKPSPTTDQDIRQMKKIMRGLHCTVAVEVEGTIRETNAAYRDGSRVTLVDLDFDKLLAEPKKLTAFLKSNPQTAEETNAEIKGFKSAKIETAPEVKIKFE